MRGARSQGTRVDSEVQAGGLVAVGSKRTTFQPGMCMKTNKGRRVFRIGRAMATDPRAAPWRFRAQARLRRVRTPGVSPLRPLAGWIVSLIL